MPFPPLTIRTARWTLGDANMVAGNANARRIALIKHLVLAAAMVAVSPALAAEKTVDFTVDGQKVVGTLNIPDGATKPPVVLLLHGFTGSRNELEIPAVKEGIFARAAKAWADKGIASLRIDFRGNGESEGKFEDMTMEGLVADADAALDFLAASSEVDSENMAVVGWSMGGAVGAALAGQSEHDLASATLWAPGSNMASALALLLGPQNVKAGLAAKDSPVNLKLPWGAEIKLKAGFFESMYRIDPVAEIEDYDGPLLVAVGTNDDVVYPQPASGQVLLDYHEGPEELWVRPMDHVFNAFKGVEMVDELIAKTGDFLNANFD